MRRLARAAEVWIWAEVAIKFIAVLALAGVMAAAIGVIVVAARVFDLI